MRATIQRVSRASVEVDNHIAGVIQEGLLILLGVCDDDTQDDIAWLSKKIAQLRIFRDEHKPMNRSLIDIDGDALVVSQFTLYANTKKGNRPSFVDAASPELAKTRYEEFVKALEKQLDKRVATGIFGADMQVSLVNDGPVTLNIDTKNR
jgi:D-tyrosyl-tRNA(Tyr) deacylase